MHAVAEYRAVGTGEVDVLEYAVFRTLGLRVLNPCRPDTFTGEIDDLSRFDLSDKVAPLIWDDPDRLSRL